MWKSFNETLWEFSESNAGATSVRTLEGISGIHGKCLDKPLSRSLDKTVEIFLN